MYAVAQQVNQHKALSKSKRVQSAIDEKYSLGRVKITSAFVPKRVKHQIEAVVMSCSMMP